MLKYKDETIGIGKVDLSCVNDLKMLGYTVPNECPIQNYTDSNGVFHQRVGRVDLGTLSWTYDSSSADRKYFYAPITGSKASGICYTKKYTYNGTSAIKDKQVMIFSNSNVIIKDLTYTDATTFKSAMSGQYLYYELATEITKSVDGNEYGIFDKGQTVSTTCTKNAVTQITITFNKTFNSAPTVVATMVTNSSGVDVGNMTVAVMNITTTGATLYVYNNGASDRKPAFNWIAIQ